MAVAPLEPRVLSGTYVRLEPLTLAHLEPLCAVGLDAELWCWTLEEIRSVEEMRRYIEAALAAQRQGSALPFVTIEQSSGAVVGSTRYGNISLADGRVEIGWTWVARRWQRSAVNTEAKYLLLRHAFEVLGCGRVELKTDALNERSRRAIERLGAIQEGVLRRHMRTSRGRVRDTVYYSILDEEWPHVKARLEQRLEGGHTCTGPELSASVMHHG